MKPLITIILSLYLATSTFATQEKKQIKLNITAPGGYADMAAIYFDLGVTPAFITNQDGPKVYGQLPTTPTIYSFSSDLVICSTNGYSDLGSSVVIPLGIRTDTNGIHIFSTSLIHNFDSTSIIQLEDRQENVFINLRSSSYSVYLPNQMIANERFYLHVSQAVVLSVSTAGCANNDGALHIIQDNCVTWASIQLQSLNGNVVALNNNFSGNYTFSNLAEGNYDLLFIHQAYLFHKAIYITGNMVDVRVHPSTIIASVNQEIAFNTTSNHATHYLWEFGDDAQITDIANPGYSYTQAGIYKVVVTASNAAGCQSKDSVMITISAATPLESVDRASRNLYAYSNSIIVQLNEKVQPDAVLSICNLLGQTVETRSITNPNTIISMNESEAGYYFARLQNDHIITTKKVFVSR